MKQRKQLGIAGLTVAALFFAMSSSFGQGVDCNTAVAVTPGTYTADGPSTGGLASNLCFGAGATNADWYMYTASANGTIDVYSCLGGADTRLSIYSGTCATLFCENSNDDACLVSIGGPNYAAEIVSMPVTGGTVYYIEWDDRWTSSGFNWVLNFSCPGAPQATDSLYLDCANNQFFVDVTVSSLGSGATVDITNTAGAPTIAGVGLGTHTVGPFASGTVVQYQVVNNSDPGCNYFSATLKNFPCPIVSCGPDQYNFCYGANMDTVLVFQSATTFALALEFAQGTIDNSDEIIIYDGKDFTAPILFQGTSGGNMTGVVVTSTNPDNYLSFRLISDGTSDCVASAGLYDNIDFSVFCLNCTNPGASYSVVKDCVHREWFIEVDVNSTGNAASVDIVNSYNLDTLFNVGLGAAQVGPFPMDTMYNATVLSSLNPLCHHFGPDLLANVDSCLIVGCGIDNYTYCYENGDDAWFSFQADTAVYQGPLTVSFLAGEMLGVNDRVIVYNGKDDLSAVLMNTNFGGNLGGQSASSTNPGSFITVRFISDLTGSCDDGAVTEMISFDIGCGAVGIDELSTNDLRIYPNPANDRLFLEFAGVNEPNAQIQVFDALGSLVMQSNVGFQNGVPAELPVDQLNSGNYLLQVVSDKVFKVQRFQISR